VRLEQILYPPVVPAKVVVYSDDLDIPFTQDRWSAMPTPSQP